MTIKSFNDFLTEQTKEITFVFGRFNPPTVGHEKLFEVLKKQSRGGAYRIYASKSVDAKKNPLNFKEKIKFLRKMFPKHARNIMADPDVRNVLDIAVKLYDQGFTGIAMVAGSDRIREFDILLNKYNGKKAKHGFYQFEGIKVLSAGERDPDAEGVSGMSASKMRLIAADGDLQRFVKSIPSLKTQLATDLYYAVRKGMGLKKESARPHVELPPVSEVREDYIDGSLFNVGDYVRIKETREKGQIVVCGSNYVMVEIEEVRKRFWLDAVEIIEYNELGTTKTLKKYLKDTPFAKIEGREDPDIGKRKGSQPAGYYKGLGKSTKSKRAAHFKKHAKMDDDNPAAYKKAPGDAQAKTKPSKHTLKFKRMYGEMSEYLTFEDFMVEDKGVDAALKKKADKSGMPLGILRKVFNRGVAAWRTGHRPGTNATQWGLARVNSFVTKSKGTWGKADKDLAAKVRG